jgi:hypothetical protein
LWQQTHEPSGQPKTNQHKDKPANKQPQTITLQTNKQITNNPDGSCGTAPPAQKVTWANMVNGENGQCLDVAGKSTASGATVDTYACINNAANEVFGFVGDASSAAGATLVDSNSGKCVVSSQSNGAFNSNGNVHIADCTSKTQRWSAAANDGTVRPASDLKSCLQVSAASAKAFNGVLQVAPCTQPPSKSQLWARKAGGARTPSPALVAPLPGFFLPCCQLCVSFFLPCLPAVCWLFAFGVLAVPCCFVLHGATLFLVHHVLLFVYLAANFSSPQPAQLILSLCSASNSLRLSSIEATTDELSDCIYLVEAHRRCPPPRLPRRRSARLRSTRRLPALVRLGGCEVSKTYRSQRLLSHPPACLQAAQSLCQPMEARPRPVMVLLFPRSVPTCCSIPLHFP